MSGRGCGIRVARGFGLGAVTISVMAAASVGLDKPQVAHASVLTRTTQQIGKCRLADYRPGSVRNAEEHDA